MTKNEKTKEQQDSLQQLLSQGEALEVVIREKGWEYILQYFQTRLQTFTNDMMMNEKKPTIEFEKERSELIGVRKLLGWVNSCIKAVEDDREKARKSPKE